MNRWNKNNLPYIGLLLLVSFIFGASFIVTSSVLAAGYSAEFVSFYRPAVAALVMFIFCRKKIGSIVRGQLFGGVLSGFFLFMGSLLQTKGLAMTTPTNSAFLSALGVILVPLLCWPVFQRRPSMPALAAAVLGALGVIVISFDSSQLQLSLGRGELLTLSCTIFFASHTISVNYFSRRSLAMVFSFIEMATYAFFAFVYFLLVDRRFEQFVPEPTHLLLLSLALFATCLTFFLSVVAQKHLLASQVSVIGSTESLFAAIVSLSLGFEAFRPQLLAGCALIFGAVCICNANAERHSA